jgi:hypothetical protein
LTSIAAEPDEVLDTGYLATTPDHDNLVLDFVRGESAAYKAIAVANGGRVEHDADVGVHLTDLGLATPFGNTAHITRPVPESATSRLVEALRGFYDGRAGGPFLLFSAWPTPDLRPHGFTPVGHPPLMFRPTGGSAPTAPGLTVARVADPGGLADFERTMFDAYPVPEMLPWRQGSFLHASVLDTQWQFFVGYEGDAPVATAAAYVTDQIAMVELVSSRAEGRGKGYGAAITAAATFAAPDRPAILIASDLGRNIYGRLGYLPLLRYTLWVGHRDQPA